MAGVKECDHAVLDAVFAYLYNQATSSQLRIVVTTSTSPLTAAGATTAGMALAHSTAGGYPTTGYFTLGSSGTNRYCTIGACSCDDVVITGNAACVVLYSTELNEVMYVTTCTTQTLTTGNKVNIGTWTITVNQPT